MEPIPVHHGKYSYVNRVKKKVSAKSYIPMDVSDCHDVYNKLE